MPAMRSNASRTDGSVQISYPSSAAGLSSTTNPPLNNDLGMPFMSDPDDSLNAASSSQIFMTSSILDPSIRSQMESLHGLGIISGTTQESTTPALSQDEPVEQPDHPAATAGKNAIDPSLAAVKIESSPSKGPESSDESGGPSTRVKKRRRSSAKKSRRSSTASKKAADNTVLRESSKTDEVLAEDDNGEASNDSEDDEESQPCRVRVAGTGPKRNKLLERNRIAASKCRRKKKAWVHELEEAKCDLEAQHSQLQSDYNQLLDEVCQLKNMVIAHASCHDENIDRWIGVEAQRFVEKTTLANEQKQQQQQQQLQQQQQPSNQDQEQEENLEDQWPGEESFYYLAGGGDGAGSTTSPSTGESSNPFSWERRGSDQMSLDDFASGEASSPRIKLESFSYDHMPDELFEN